MPSVTPDPLESSEGTFSRKPEEAPTPAPQDRPRPCWDARLVAAKGHQAGGCGGQGGAEGVQEERFPSAYLGRSFKVRNSAGPPASIGDQRGGSKGTGPTVPTARGSSGHRPVAPRPPWARQSRPFPTSTPGPHSPLWPRGRHGSQTQAGSPRPRPVRAPETRTASSLAEPHRGNPRAYLVLRAEKAS